MINNTKRKKNQMSLKKKNNLTQIKFLNKTTKNKHNQKSQ